MQLFCSGKSVDRVKELISVILPCHRVDDFLYETVGALNKIQINVPLEILVVANNLDGSLRKKLDDICLNIKAFPVRVVSSEPGIVNALNTGVDLAKFEFIARIDSDDIIHPTRLQKQFDFLNLNGDYVGVGGQVNLILPDGKIKRTPFFPCDFRSIQRQLKYTNAFSHPTMLLRRSAIKKVGGYSNCFPIAEDYDLWRRMIKIGKLGNLTDTVLDYRLHSEQESNLWREKQENSVKGILYVEEMYFKEEIRYADSLNLPNGFDWANFFKQKELISININDSGHIVRKFVRHLSVETKFRFYLIQKSNFEQPEDYLQFLGNLLFTMRNSPVQTTSFLIHNLHKKVSRKLFKSKCNI